MIQRILAVLTLILAILAFFSVGIGDLTTARELAVAAGLLSVAVLL